ncbi:MAG TPA: ABC transporter permease, partial [Desulfurococcales archaeon]|nr:ABC transporter permease [Desulfurococcales archaeon]
MFMSRPVRTVILSRPEIGITIGALCLIVVFAVLDPRFLSPPTIAGILSMASELGVVTIGVALLMISGEFNLAVSSVYVLTPVTTIMLVDYGIPTPVAFVTSILIAAIIGCVIGVIVVKTGLHSFIVSLGFMMLLRGLVLFLTGGFTQEYRGDPYYLYILNGRIIGDFR